MDDSFNYMTPAGVKRIQDELQWLHNEERPRIVSEVAAAAAFGDRSDNAEYKYGKQRLREIDRRGRFLMRRLNRVRIVDPATIEGAVVRFGATVVVADEQGDEMTWRIYGEDEVDVPGGVLSWKSPIARAMMGKEAGDLVRFRVPRGFRELEILDVRYEPQT